MIHAKPEMTPKDTLYAEAYHLIKNLIGYPIEVEAQWLGTTLKQQCFEGLRALYRYKQSRYGASDTLRQAIVAIDEVRLLWQLCVDHRVITYEIYKERDTEMHRLVKQMMILCRTEKVSRERSSDTHKT